MARLESAGTLAIELSLCSLSPKLCSRHRIPPLVRRRPPRYEQFKDCQLPGTPEDIPPEVILQHGFDR
ncbi:hypothetical protein AAVH_21127, partial [Aphelenchoides avenae]